MKPIRDVVGRRSEVRVVPSVAVSAQSLVFAPGTPGQVTIPWDDVLEVRAYKVDLLTTDEVRLRLHHTGGTVELSEDQPGFAGAVRALEHVFPTMVAWREKVIQPAFAGTEVVLARRDPRSMRGPD